MSCTRPSSLADAISCASIVKFSKLLSLSCMAASLSWRRSRYPRGSDSEQRRMSSAAEISAQFSEQLRLAWKTGLKLEAWYAMTLPK
eukprot:CAMPEP_0175893128 /NCGR_PEP_ID=MMETSP0107_2-20121207/49289_1 /TAXON_ID=195067 ORGANISM="Goniomonas pacifica, Strain CCMP1869" /NCGR_SAMPLE_ID=MMETSP0107_2 /ASSEMBLY_ACC=CAM_ASM_000203 /LENGTH=86 /DNA_ID=CAMNT_0017214125 /DNA_START=52 /DNA_END=312 /DNA_ORIENTATION=+